MPVSSKDLDLQHHMSCSVFTFNDLKLEVIIRVVDIALTTIIPILSQYCYKCCYSGNRNLLTIMEAGGLAP